MRNRERLESSLVLITDPLHARPGCGQRVDPLEGQLRGLGRKIGHRDRPIGARARVDVDDLREELGYAVRDSGCDCT